jgi:hypothetical protein
VIFLRGYRAFFFYLRSEPWLILETKTGQVSCSGYPLKRRVEFCTVKQALPSFLDSRLCY